MQTDIDKQCNMEIVKVRCEAVPGMNSMSFEIPVMVNCKPIKPGDELRMRSVKSDCKVPCKVRYLQTEGSEPAAKKPRK